MTKEEQPVKAWELGQESVDQEGTGFWQRLREERGWSREDVEERTDGMIRAWEQIGWEDDLAFPDVEQLAELARLYDTTPGSLLDNCYCEKGEPIKYELDHDGAAMPGVR